MMWQLIDHWKYHCPGGCYIFAPDQQPDPYLPVKYHVPVEIFWGRMPWPHPVISDD